jgi:uncharacterized protein YijF (DUF1287 family)
MPALLLALLLTTTPDAGHAASPKALALAAAAARQVGKTTSYDPAYVSLAFPGGDVPLERGVCTDVVVRAFREVGIDLQVELNRDMRANFSRYPALWRLKHPDPNIDHRRVQNLRVWLARRGAELKVTARSADYWPGDLVTVDVGTLAHIMVVSSTLAPDGTHYLIAHNIGAGAQLEDRLFEFPITGHYRPL